jgi:hypothetical protein
LTMSCFLELKYMLFSLMSVWVIPRLWQWSNKASSCQMIEAADD